MVRLFSVGATHVGLVRTNNEDAYLAMPETGIFAISDGMGGAAAGEIASRYFIEAVQATFPDQIISSETNIALVKEVFRHSNKTILSHAVQHPHDRGLGCTGDVLVFFGNQYVIGHVGDSRVYLLRDGRLRQLTKDHSLVQLQVDQGILTAEEAKTHPKKHLILQAVGTDPILSCDILTGEGLSHDIFLLCSDGLTDMVEDYLIQDVLASIAPLQNKAENLIRAALAAGGKDNVTIVLCEVEI